MKVFFQVLAILSSAMATIMAFFLSSPIHEDRVAAYLAFMAVALWAYIASTVCPN